MRRLVMVLCLALGLTTVGCGRQRSPGPKVETTAEAAAKDWQDGCVLLQDVEPPVWDKVFAVVESNDNYKSVEWGCSDDDESMVMVDSSGYPGFGLPILVMGNLVGISGEVVVRTNYGTFYYEVTKREQAVLNDEGNNVLDAGSGKPIIDFSRKGENLYLFNPETKQLLVAEFKHGTSIVVRQ